MTFGLYDKCTYWVQEAGEPDPNDPYGGSNPSWSEPVTLDCEFVAGREMKKDRDGNEFMPRTEFFTAEPIPFGARIIEGESNDAAPPSNAEEVRASNPGTVLPGQSREYVSYTS